jgi:hypothetical protein
MAKVASGMVTNLTRLPSDGEANPWVGSNGVDLLSFESTVE